MPQFQIPHSHTKIEEICVDSSPIGGRQRKVELELSRWSGSKPPEIHTPGNFLRVVDISHKAGRSTFRIEPLSGAEGVGVVSADDAVLKVTVGKVTNQFFMQCDLIADLGRSEDARILWIYQRLLAARNNNIETPPFDDLQKIFQFWDTHLADQPLKQRTAHDMDCAQTCNRLGAIFRSNRAGYAGGGLRYYKPLKRNPDGKVSERVSDLKFDADRVRNGAQTIARRLRMEKKATTVFATHSDTTFGIKDDDIDHPGTHFVTFVGCSAAANDNIVFLIADPWPGGSICSYSSGIFGNVQSMFMGYMAYSERDHVIATTQPRAGSHNYRVIKGP